MYRNKMESKTTYYNYNAKEKEDKLISIAIMSSYATLIIQLFVLYLFNILNSPVSGQIELMSKMIVALIFLICLPTVLKRSWLMLISTYLVSIFIFLLNYMVFPQNTESLRNVFFPFFFICLPSFVYSYSIKDKNILLGIVYKISNIVFVFGIFIGILVFNSGSFTEYSMPLSYYMLLPAIINMYRFIQNKSANSMIKVIVSVALMVFIGSRGAVMSFGIYVLLTYLKSERKITYHNVLLYILGFLLIAFILIYIENITITIFWLLMKFGIYSRNLYLFSNDIFHLSGRDVLYALIIKKIVENPVIGVGVAGDRTIMGGYSHNIFLEIISGFGIIIGSIIIVVLMFISFKAAFNKNKFNSDFSIIWLSIGLVPLFVSGSYLKDFTFWIFLGFIIRLLNVKNFIKYK